MDIAPREKVNGGDVIPMPRDPSNASEPLDIPETNQELNEGMKLLNL